MYLAMHVPMFGSMNVDSKPIECPTCPRGVSKGASDWQERNISTCDHSDAFTCNRCGTVVTVMWGLEEPDHLSTWQNSEHCPHRLCRIKYAELQAFYALPKAEIEAQPPLPRRVEKLEDEWAGPEFPITFLDRYLWFKVIPMKRWNWKQTQRLTRWRIKTNEWITRAKG